MLAPLHSLTQLLASTVESQFWSNRNQLPTTTFQLKVKVKVKVVLQLTVSRSVCLGVKFTRSRSHITTDGQSASSSWCLDPFEAVTGCYIYLNDNNFLYFSCRAPSLTRGRVCNLQCNDASSNLSYIATDGLSASFSWCRAPSAAHNQILISLFDSYFVFSVQGSLTHVTHEQGDQ
jgi:hypothetical protein